MQDSFVWSRLEYGNAVLYNISHRLLHSLQQLPMLSSWMFSRCFSVSYGHTAYTVAVHLILTRPSSVVWFTILMVLRKSLSSTSIIMFLPRIAKEYGGLVKVPRRPRTTNRTWHACCLPSMKKRTWWWSPVTMQSLVMAKPTSPWFPRSLMLPTMVKASPYESADMIQFGWETRNEVPTHKTCVMWFIASIGHRTRSAPLRFVVVT